jgi:predicted dienelactone hydrolase
MTRSITSATLLATVAATSLNAAGYTTAPAPAAHRDQPLNAHIWYPAKKNGTEIILGKNAVFTGHPVQADATAKDSAFPLVILSHGSGGNAPNLAWIAASLADKGMIVIAANHPGTTSGDSTPAQTLKMWERPADQSALIDLAEAGLPYGIQADTSRIASVGFSLGGYTALATAGARVSKDDYVSYCDEFEGKLDCAWFNNANIDFDTIDQPRYEQSNRDPRVTTVVAIDPAASQAYQADSLAQFDVPVQIINLGSAGEIPAAVDGATIQADLKSAKLEFVDQAAHFSFLGKCTGKGWMIIKMAGEDPICSETGTRDRADIHQELQIKIGAFLHEHLIEDDDGS